MRKFIVVVASVLMIGAAHAGSYQDALKQCGAEWRASSERAQVQKGQGRDAWNKYRADCTKRVGWTNKSGKKS